MESNDTRNPYLRKNGKPWLRRSVVAFLDILGYKNFLTTAIKQRREHKGLLELHEALNKANRELQPFKLSHSEPDLYAVRSFTDNILIGFPIERFRSNGSRLRTRFWPKLCELNCGTEH